MLRAFTLTLIAALSSVIVAQDPVPELLLIVREPLRPGGEEAYGRIESEIAEVCARLKCPNPYLALESLSAPKEVWWLNTFRSEADKDRVEQAYARNEPLSSRLRQLSERKQPLTFEPTTVLTKYRRDLGGASWKVSGARFFVITLSSDQRKGDGVVFQAPDGRLYSFAPAASRADADRLAARAHGSSAVVAVQPSWSFPAKEWIAADPEFWEANSAAHDGRAVSGSSD